MASPGAIRVSEAQHNFHLLMASACGALLAVGLAGCLLTSIHTDWFSSLAALLLVFAILSPIPAYLHEKRLFRRRDSVLTIYWAITLNMLMPLPVLVAARLNRPFGDSILAHTDELLGINVGNIAIWAKVHLLGAALNQSYGLLQLLLVAAILIPALTGRLESAQRFLISNVISYAITVLVFALFPAVGPWSYYHFSPAPDQALYQAQLLTLRHPGAYEFLAQGTKVITFPSFHAIWAILCSAALWEIRFLRIPITLLAACIALSTMTTGWHYGSDVLAAIMVAVISISAAQVLVRSNSDLTRKPGAACSSTPVVLTAG